MANYNFSPKFGGFDFGPNIKSLILMCKISKFSKWKILSHPLFFLCDYWDIKTSHWGTKSNDHDHIYKLGNEIEPTPCFGTKIELYKFRLKYCFRP